MLSDGIYALTQYRIERSEECLKSANVLLGIDDFFAVLDRSFYAIFHAVRAIMALDGTDRRKHSGVISYFQQNYVKSGVFDKKYSEMVQDAFELKQECDYEDFYVLSKEEAITQLKNSNDFVNTVKKYIEKQINNI
ncbi:MAG: HEPN domain-containing protein [Clostridia bacterium]|nr:HEPN domain-containing protein [Clostridia bacterium]